MYAIEMKMEKHYRLIPVAPVEIQVNALKKTVHICKA
jgi:hypothetical protein